MQTAGSSAPCALSNAEDRIDTQDCPGLRLVRPSQRMQLLSYRHAKRVIASGVMSYHPQKIRSMYVTLWKWELVRMHHLDAILFADLDIDLLPDPAKAAAIAAEWMRRLPRQLATRDRRVRYIGYGDVTTPLNTGLFWLFPPENEALYSAGLDVLHSSWNWSHGWNVSGTPRQLVSASQRQRVHSSARRMEVDVDQFGAGWDRIDYGDMDQGFFFYLLHFGQQATFSLSGAMHTARHYVMHPLKPWARALQHRPMKEACSHDNLIRHAWLRQAGMPLNATESLCAAAFRDVLKDLDAHFADGAASCCATLGKKAPTSVGGHVRVSVF